MRLQGTTLIKATRQAVWDYVTDGEKVAGCAPGVEKVEIIEPRRKFKAVLSVGFGTVKARFNADVEFTELDEPNRAVFKGRGVASAGVGDAAAEMVLSDAADGQVELKWTADVTIGGTLATLAARLMGPVTQKLSAQFFECMKAKIEA
ncbi:MAG: carbon monoxide dehydrogenase subunit G [Anaerolineales bacterium]|nr:carbon monoxide dehydrogenase subunit G [Anaerolineales bacterium]